jgi:ribonuclease E
VEVPRIDPKPILESAGLVMIETDRSKAATVAPQPEEPVQLGRPRRERPTATTPEEETLQQVETKR